MKTETKILIGIFIFSLVLILGAIFFLGKETKNVTSDTIVNIDYSKGQKIGSDSAKVKMVEYSDLQCPACKAVEPFVKQVREKYKDNLQFVYKHFPLMQHPFARKAANFAEYAGTENKFWEIHDKLFETQDDWSKLSDPTEYFVKLGLQFGLDENKIKEAISKLPYNKLIDENLAEGQRIGVDATPTIYINNKKLILKSFSDIDAKIAQELSAK